MNKIFTTNMKEVSLKSELFFLQGGFVSTQDTVVALQALSLYAQSVSKDPTDITIQVRPTTRRDIWFLKNGRCSKL